MSRKGFPTSLGTRGNDGLTVLLPFNQSDGLYPCQDLRAGSPHVKALVYSNAFPRLMSANIVNRGLSSGVAMHCEIISTSGYEVSPVHNSMKIV